MIIVQIFLMIISMALFCYATYNNANNNIKWNGQKAIETRNEKCQFLDWRHHILYTLTQHTRKPEKVQQEIAIHYLTRSITFQVKEAKNHMKLKERKNSKNEKENQFPSLPLFFCVIAFRCHCFIVFYSIIVYILIINAAKMETKCQMTLLKFLHSFLTEKIDVIYFTINDGITTTKIIIIILPFIYLDEKMLNAPMKIHKYGRFIIFDDVILFLSFQEIDENMLTDVESTATTTITKY